MTPSIPSSAATGNDAFVKASDDSTNPARNELEKNTGSVALRTLKIDIVEECIPIPESERRAIEEDLGGRYQIIGIVGIGSPKPHRVRRDSGAK